MSATIFNVIELIVNNQPVLFVPNTLTFTTGQGEQIVRVHASGALVESVVSNNLETNKSMIKFEVFSTSENFNLITEWKSLPGSNALTISGPDFSPGVTFQQMTLINNYEVNAVSEGTIAVEFEGTPVV